MTSQVVGSADEPSLTPSLDLVEVSKESAPKNSQTFPSSAQSFVVKTASTTTMSKVEEEQNQELLTEDQLVVRCVECFDVDEEDEVDDIQFAHALFLSHQWLSDSLSLITHFVNFYQESRNVEQREAVCRAVAFWIEKFPMHFDAQPQVCAQVVRLKTIAEDVNESIRNGLDVSSLPSFAWLRAVSVRNPLAKQTAFSLSFVQASASDISTSLSHIDYRVLSRISITELKQYVKDGHLRSCPMLERSISVFNNLSNWVQCMILNKTTPKERAEILVKFVHVAKHLRKINNFNTLMSVVGGITHSSVARLAKTYAILSNDIKKELNQMTTLLSANHNFSEYRKALAACNKKFRIPIIGVHLKDLVAINCSGANFEKTKCISSEKLVKLAKLLSNFLVFNQKEHNLPEMNMDLINTLKVSLDIRYSDDDIYELSLRREPKTFMNFEPSRGVVFAEWASGVSVAPDNATVSKHISAMVDAVFKHYDHDRDGFISQEEFQLIAGNFPFIDAFVIIDVDMDGQISKDELKTYFMAANKNTKDLRRGFKHNFHETTFLTPTTCNHCNKLLWGILRQGFKCKDCGLAVHNCCKSNAVAECRRKSSSNLTKAAEWLSSPRGSVRSKLFSTCKSSRPRTVSAVATSPTTETAKPTCSARLNPTPTLKDIRPQSESTEYYHSGSTPDEEVGLVSLACEEVFEDDDLADISSASYRTA
ncbi:hypothetical protein L5515_008705 [Caenorhabditis briggsae]|uniref:Protein CBR-RGEF-1 n=1 Tax=Caenorhabditis briggsae TaxID=6238 RepID=A0AAE9FB44_CAEBR|nr:hypothetical protein L5515_008705 [Caenorhabditis briggsae]